jgi:hypothetical protein
MYNPKDILTEDGCRKLFIHVGNIEFALFYILNHANDLHIDDEQLETLYKMQEMVEGDSPLLLTGDGEEFED